jgi:hypothetical protein
VTGLSLAIYIPTLGRVRRQRTWASLCDAARAVTLLVIDPKEERDFKLTGLPYVVCPLQGITRVRRWILEQSPANKVLMLDDDLIFAVRTGSLGKDKDGNPFHRYKHTQREQTGALFQMIEQKLDSYAHCSISPRQFCAQEMRDWRENTRQLRFLAYHRPTVIRHAKLGRVEVMEDFDITLQLLRAGYPNCTGYHYTQDQPGTQTAGGCSSYRTHELQDVSARKLAELHPGFVTLRQKKNKTGGAFGTRTDVVIAWQKAFDSAGGRKELE